MRPIRGPVAAAMLGLLSCVLLMGCEGAGASDPTRSTAADGPSDPAATAVPTRGSSGTSTDRPDKTSCAVDVDLSAVTWTWPEGFRESSGFAQVVPLGREVLARYAVPDGDRGRDVLGVVVYDEVPAPEATIDPDRITCRERASATIDSINEALDVTVLSGPEDVVLAGLPALRENVSQPGGYTYHAVWLVAGEQILHVTCQYDRQPDAVTAACDELIASVTLP